MDVLNKKERLRAFLSFLVIFIITMVVVIIAIFFNISIPRDENRMLRNENDKHLEGIEYQIKIAKRMDSIKNMIDSIDAPGSYSNYYYEQIASDKLAKVYNSINVDKDVLIVDNHTIEVYKNMMTAYKQIIDYKLKIRTLTRNDNVLDSLNRIIALYKSNLDEVKKDLDICRQISRQNN